MAGFIPTMPLLRIVIMIARTYERPIVAGLFVLFITHLLLYVWLVPPWQHYDEPTHFEYAALIRELGRLPTLEEQIPELRRAIADSMVEAGFFRNPELPLTAPSPDATELSLGVNERGHPPLYYILVALGTLPFRDAPISVQLLAARCVSVGLAAGLFFAAYAVLRLLLGQRWELRCVVLAALALQPAFIDNLSSVNSDVLANLVAVLLLLAGVGVIRRPGWRMALLSVALVLLAWNVKRTLLVYSLVVPAAWLLASPAVVRRTVVGLAGVAAVLGAVYLAATPWMLADWQTSGVAASSRQDAHAGRHAFTLQNDTRLVQSLYPYRLIELDPQPLTLAAWMRADRPVIASSPVLQIDAQIISRTVALDTSWRLITVTAELPANRQNVAVQLVGGAEGATIYVDSVALVAGEADLPGENEPDGSYERGVLGRLAPRNLVRNAGAERHVPTLSGPLVWLSSRAFNDAGLAQALSSIFNPRWIAAVYPQQLWLLFRGSWGVFGWGQYTVSGGWFTPLALLVVVSLAGSARRRIKVAADEEPWRARAWWLCVIAVLIGWGTALLRVHNQPFPGAMFWSFGRYTFVAMLPSLLFFVAGFRAAFPRLLRNQATAAQLAFLAVFALIGLSVFFDPV